MTPINDATWFVVVPDCPAGAAVAERLRPDAGQVVRYPSGRPWMVGRWAAGEVATAMSGRSAVVVIGQHPATSEYLAAYAAKMPSICSLDRLAAELPGSYHLAAAADGKVRIQGSVSGVRQVFFTRTAGATVAAGSPGVLARLAGARLDEMRLAIELMYPALPDFLATPMWQGIEALAPDRYLQIDADGSSLAIRWWEPPDPELPAADGASALFDALSAAVEVRTRGTGTISCDLSGGLDSTSLCFLAARSGRERLIAVTQRGLDPAHDDAVWAGRAIGHLDGVEHLVLDPDELPPRYTRPRELADCMDEPGGWARDYAIFYHLSALATARGSRVHLTGHGGDQLLCYHPEYLHTVPRAHPWSAPGYLRAVRAQQRLPLLTALRLVAERQDYASWLAATAKALTTEVRPLEYRGRGSLGWGYRMSLPPWMTAEAADAVRAALLRAAATAEPLARHRGQHAVLEAVRECSQAMRPMAQLSSRAGLAVAVPYLDDQVVEAVLRVRLHERATPRQYKPLLTRAMNGIVPAEVLARTTKGDFSAEGRAGLRRNRADLAALFDDPILARLGLIDAEAARSAVAGAHPTLLPLALVRTLTCELWLRAHYHSALEHAGGAA